MEHCQSAARLSWSVGFEFASPSLGERSRRLHHLKSVVSKSWTSPNRRGYTVDRSELYGSGSRSSRRSRAGPPSSAAVAAASARAAVFVEAAVASDAPVLTANGAEHMLTQEQQQQQQQQQRRTGRGRGRGRKVNGGQLKGTIQSKMVNNTQTKSQRISDGGGKPRAGARLDAVNSEIMSVLGGMTLSTGAASPAESLVDRRPATDSAASLDDRLAARLADLLAPSLPPALEPELKAMDDPKAEKAAVGRPLKPPTNARDGPPNFEGSAQAPQLLAVATTEFADSTDGRTLKEPSQQEGTSPSAAVAGEPVKAGDPLGRKALGKAAVQWLAEGAAQLAADVVSREEQGREGFEGVSRCEDIIALAQEYARRRPMPRQQEHKCELALGHFPTVWDHVQRQVQKALESAAAETAKTAKFEEEEEDVVGVEEDAGVGGTRSSRAVMEAGLDRDWSSSPAWQLLKRLSRSEEYKLATRTPRAAGQAKESWISRNARAAAQERINAYVEKGLALLELERQVELQAVGIGVPGTAKIPEKLAVVKPGQSLLPQLRVPQLASAGAAEGAGAVPGGSAAGAGPQQRVAAGAEGSVGEESEECEAEVEEELERAEATLRGVVVLSSRVGSDGQLLLTLSGPRGRPLPPTRLSPGDLVSIAVDYPPSAVHPVQWQELGRGMGSRRTKEPEGGAPAVRWVPQMDKARLGVLRKMRLRGKVYGLRGGDVSEEGGPTVGPTSGAISGVMRLVVALEGRQREADVARLFGLLLCVERLEPLVDATTYERNRAALEALREKGLGDACPARAVVAALFAPSSASDGSASVLNEASDKGSAMGTHPALEGSVAMESAEGQGGHPPLRPGGIVMPAAASATLELYEGAEGALFSRDGVAEIESLGGAGVYSREEPSGVQGLSHSASEGEGDEDGEGASRGVAGSLSFDESQKRAMELALQRHLPVVAIQGPPGTGKTVVLTEIITRALEVHRRETEVDGGTVSDSESERGSDGEGEAEEAVLRALEGGRGRGKRKVVQGLGKVLASAPTNAAVDVLVERLAARGVPVVRVGNPERVSAAVLDRSLDSLMERKLAKFRRDVARRRADLRADMRACRGDAPIRQGLQEMLRKLGRLEKEREREAMAGILKEAQVVLCTATGAGDPLVRSMVPFSLVVLDEAAQATEPASWIPLLLGKRAVLSGDPCQLAPTVLSREASREGLGVSLIERVFQEASFLPQATAAKAAAATVPNFSAHLAVVEQHSKAGSKERGAVLALAGGGPEASAISAGPASATMVLEPKRESTATTTQASRAGGLGPGDRSTLLKHSAVGIDAGGISGKGSPVRGGGMPRVACCILAMQYRMNDAVASWSSARLYGGRVQPAPVVAGQLLRDLPHVRPCQLTGTPWLLLDTRSRTGLQDDTCAEQRDPQGSGSLVNEGEAELVVNHVMALLDAGMRPSEIAVQSPYQAQVQLIRARLEEASADGAVHATTLPGPEGEALRARIVGASSVEVATVDSFQGREAEAVIISMVRANPEGTVGFLGDRRRMNVAVTRARRHVALICDSTTVSRNLFLRNLLLHVREHGVVCSAGNVSEVYSQGHK